MSAQTTERPAVETIGAPSIPTDELQARAFWAGLLSRFNEAPLGLVGYQITERLVRDAAPTELHDTDDELFDVTDASAMAGYDWADVLLGVCGLLPRGLTETQKSDFAGACEVAHEVGRALGRKPDVELPELDDETPATLKLTAAEVLKLMRYARAGGLR